MAYLKCPYDPKSRFQLKFCKEMQKTNIRTQCQKCEHFHKEEKTDGQKHGNN